MIHIHRDPSTAAALITPTVRPKGTPPATKAERELAKAIQFYTAPPAPARPKRSLSTTATTPAATAKTATPKDFEFKVYKDKEIAKQLRKMFFGKCAYCDSRYRHVTSTDIEHFRPKGAVVISGVLQSPGYYWLGATWDNLLPSCPLCNRVGDHELVGKTALERGGKGCEFPLRDESKRVRKDGDSLDEENKERLLLNPCEDTPEDVLAYLATGAIVAKDGLDAFNASKALESIRVYGLFRAELEDKRKEKMLQLEARLDAVDDASYNLNWMVKGGITGTRLTRQQSRLSKEIAALRKLFADTSPYLGVLRFQIRAQLNGDRAKRLKRRRIDLKDLLP